MRKIRLHKKHTYFLFAYWHDKRWKKFVGATVKIWDLAYNLASLGNDVFIFLPKYHFTQDHLPFKVIEVPVLNIPMLRSFSFSIFLIFYLLLYILKFPLDVIYVRRGISFIPLLFLKITKAVLIFEVNDDPYRKSQEVGIEWVSHLRYRLSIKIDELFLKACHIGVIITEEIKNKIIRKYPDLNKKLIVIPSGSNLSLFTPLDKKECRSRLNFKNDTNYVGFVGSLLSYQGIDTLITASPYVLKIHPSTVFLIIGEGPMRPIWTQQIKEKGLRQSFLFCGEIEYKKVPLYLGAMDIGVAPFLSSVGLSSPVKIFDYLACGRPVIASNIQGSTDIFAESGAVRLIKPEDPIILAEAIKMLLENKPLAETMGEKGRLFMENKFNRSDTANKISDEVDKIMLKRIF